MVQPMAAPTRAAQVPRGRTDREVRANATAVTTSTSAAAPRYDSASMSCSGPNQFGWWAGLTVPRAYGAIVVSSELGGMILSVSWPRPANSTVLMYEVHGSSCQATSATPAST